MTLGLFTFIAFAHPYGDQAAAHRLAVEVRARQVNVEWQIDVPLVVIRAGGSSPEADLERMRRELESALVLTVNGQRFPANYLEQYAADPNSTVFRLSSQAPLPRGPVDLTLEDGSLPELTTWQRTDVHLDPAWQLESSNLAVQEGESTWILPGRWRREHPALRLSKLRLAPNGTRLHHLWWWLRGEPSRFLGSPAPSPHRPIGILLGTFVAGSFAHNGRRAIAWPLMLISGLAPAPWGLLVGLAGLALAPPTYRGAALLGLWAALAGGVLAPLLLAVGLALATVSPGARLDRRLLLPAVPLVLLTALR